MDLTAGGRRPVAVVTGAASGIGRAAVALLRAEHDVIGVDLREIDPADGCVGFVADVSDPGAWQDVHDHVAALGGIDLLYLNAGTASRTDDDRRLETMTAAEYRRLMSVNVDGVVLGCLRLGPLVRDGGAVVATASIAGVVGLPQDPAYAAAKHAVVGWVRSIAPQLARRGVTVNAVCPGLVDTPMVPERVLAHVRRQGGIAMSSSEDVARAAIGAARGGGTGETWICEADRPAWVLPAPQLTR